MVGRGVARLDGTFFSNSMVGVVGEGGGAYHAIMGTLVITALTTLISVPTSEELKNSPSSRPMPRLTTSQTSETSGTIASPKALTTRQVTSRSVARRRPSTDRASR